MQSKQHKEYLQNNNIDSDNNKSNNKSATVKRRPTIAR
jgi:hypothetical protein